MGWWTIIYTTWSTGSRFILAKYGSFVALYFNDALCAQPNHQSEILAFNVSSNH